MPGKILCAAFRNRAFFRGLMGMAKNTLNRHPLVFFGHACLAAVSLGIATSVAHTLYIAIIVIRCLMP